MKEIMLFIKWLFSPERYCKACCRRVQWNDGLVMGEHGFTCTKCLYEGTEDTQTDHHYTPPDTMTVCYWPDGFWCFSDELEYMVTSRSDDFGTFEVSLNDDDEDIDDMVEQLNSGPAIQAIQDVRNASYANGRR